MGTQLKNYKEKNSYENLPLSFDVLQSELYTHTHAHAGTHTHTDVHTNTHTNVNKDTHREPSIYSAQMHIQYLRVHSEHAIFNP